MATLPHGARRRTGSAPAAARSTGCGRCCASTRRSPSASIETGTPGEGGDRTLVIDAAAEDAVFAELERAARRRARASPRSPRSAASSTSATTACCVVIDPIDGSLNAKRGLPHHALSIAVADGPTMADVALRLRATTSGPGEEWRGAARRGRAARRRAARPPPPERRTRDGRLELVGDRVGRPALGRRVRRRARATRPPAARDRLDRRLAVPGRRRALRRDGVAGRCRAVDAAAAQLIVREAGGLVAFPACDDPLGAPLDLEPHSPVVAARTPEALAAARRRCPST